ncbi:putative lipoprotein [Neisseria meningitidis 97020]|nr:putative lipoprotein [Neisseria meningitidis 97020]EOB63547.1 putative lipoprotein [Neisseria meningitidis 97018]
MKQMLLAVGVAAVLAGCGKDAGGYEGYWPKNRTKKRV